VRRPLKPALVGHFERYAAFHRHPVNRLLHKLAIPLIVFHIAVMLDWVVLARVPGLPRPLTLAHLVVAAIAVWYLSLDVALGLLMSLLYLACLPLGWMTPRPVVVAIAVLGWTVQLVGHSVFEKRSPAFLTNLLQALVGPLYFVARGLGVWRGDDRESSPA
jgi:uncharacterized membrane protein YGL010W